MIKQIFQASVALLATTLAPGVLALTIGNAPTIDVGLEDLFVYASTKNELPNSNPTSEESWVESILGFDVTYAKYGNNVPITATNEDSTVFAWELADVVSDYFVVKNAAFWALFENLDDLTYAVVDADSGYLPGKMNFGNATISHYGVVNGQNPQCQGLNCEPSQDCPGPRCEPPPYDVPVPATIFLFAVSLAGLGWTRRKKV